MKAHFILFALCGLLTSATAMMVEDEEDGVFQHGFSMADEMDESALMEDDQEMDMEEDDMERIADPLRVRIRIRRPPPFGLGGFGGFGGLGGYAGLGGMGLSGGFGLGFDQGESHDDMEETFSDVESLRSSDPAMEDDSSMTDDNERQADPKRIGIRIQPPFSSVYPPLADPVIEDIKIKERIRIREPYRYGRYRYDPFRYNPFTRSVTRPPLTIRDETDSTINTSKPEKKLISPLDLLARSLANSSLLRQRFGLLFPRSFWCRRFGSAFCGRRRPFMPPIKFCFYKRVCV